jgi:hypothetical protein
LNERPFEGLRFQGEWRRYQQLALDAFDRDRAAGRRKTYLVAPPGSGKTLVGIEAARRIGGPAVVLAPNSAVQAQWVGAVSGFEAPAGFARPEPGAPLTCLTYQALCQLDDPSAVLDGVVERRWAEQRAMATGQTLDHVEGEARSWTGEAAARRERELRRVAATIKREIARAEHGELHLGHLLSDGARSRIAALKGSGVTTVVLDECHHLASLWGIRYGQLSRRWATCTSSG